MSPERAKAYGRVMQTLAELGPNELLEAERERIRYAADNLIFSEDLANDLAARDAVEDVERLCRALIASGRWEPEMATRLADDLFDCGPARPVAALELA